MANNIFYTSRAICESYKIDIETLVNMVEWNIAAPSGSVPSKWLFSSSDMQRLEVATKYYHYLGLDPAATSVALELIEELDQLRNRINMT